MKNKIIVEKIIKYINKVLQYTKGVEKEDFISNSMMIEACVFNLGQIGELANKIDQEFETEHSDIPWRILYGLRNKIVHDYEGVNLDLIWEIVSEDLESLLKQLNDLKNQI